MIGRYFLRSPLIGPPWLAISVCVGALAVLSPVLVGCWVLSRFIKYTPVER